MKIIYRINGSDFFTDRTPVSISKGTVVKIYSTQYVVVQVEVDYHCEDPTNDIELIVDLELKQETSLIEGKFVQVQKIWAQSINNLTLYKKYRIVRETERYFAIMTDQGVERSYQHDNTQFLKL